MIIVVDDETLLNKVDFDNNEVWLLNKKTDCELDNRVHESEMAQTFVPNTEKFPRLLTEICKYYNKGEVLMPDEKIKVITNDKKSFKKVVEFWVCDEDWIDEV